MLWVTTSVKKLKATKEFTKIFPHKPVQLTYPKNKISLYRPSLPPNSGTQLCCVVSHLFYVRANARASSHFLNFKCEVFFVNVFDYGLETTVCECVGAMLVLVVVVVSLPHAIRLSHTR